jgi:hypothetical protein
MSSRKRSRGESLSSESDSEDGKRHRTDGGDGCVTSVGFTPRQVNIHVTGPFSSSYVHCNVVENGQRRKKWASALRKQYRDKNKQRQRRKEERRKRQNPESAEKAEERRREEEQKRQAEAGERLEERRRAHVEQTGEEITAEDFKYMEETEREQRRDGGRLSADAQGQTRIFAYFPRKLGGDAVPSSQSEVNTLTGRLNEAQVSHGSEEGGEPIMPSVTPTDEQCPVPSENTKMYLRLAFLKKQEIDKMKKTPSMLLIRKSSMIGPVTVERLAGESSFEVDESEFLKLRDPGKRLGGIEVGAKKFRELTQALKGADWTVAEKYLSQRHRMGENNDWTPEQVDIIIKAVEGGSAERRSYNEAARYLNDTRKMSAGYDWKDINAEKVRHVYRNRDKLGSQSTTSKRGRRRLLSPQCEKALTDFVQETLDGDINYRLCYYMDRFEKILAEHKEDTAFYDGCKDPIRYLRNLIRHQSGSRRQTTTYGGKELSNEDRLSNTTDNFLRLAYLVRQYGLTKNDVYNFDETAVRFHEDATGKVIARKGTKIVRGEAFEGSLDHRLCCTFIPMVNCSGEKFDPALIFKGTKNKTGAIPGSKNGFKAFQRLYDDEGNRKICFMQNEGKWSTNDTMVQWLKGHFIPQVHAAKAERRAANETTVSNKYVVILDGVSTHCLSEKSGPSWITQVQAEDPDLILLWLPPNMTGDLQPLDVNFNRPFKATYRPQLARLKMKQRAEQESNPPMERTCRENSAFQKLKEVVIKGIISAYKSVPRDQIEKGWTKAGKYVYEDNKVAQQGSGYHSAWDTGTQQDAVTRFNAGTLFYEGMSGGVSVVGGPQFIPRAGRKRKQPAEDGTGQVPEGGMDASDQETVASTQQYSEYGSSQCPDGFVDSDDEEDELIEGMADCRLGKGEGGGDPLRPECPGRLCLNL